MSPHAPFADDVRNRLPVQYRFDTLGKLIELHPGASGQAFGRSPVIRLTTLCGAWQLFDLMKPSWRIQPNDFGQFSNVLAFVTGGRERPSLYQDLSANLSKCLLAVRVRRAFSQEDELDLTEEWFVTGNDELTFEDARGNDSLLFHFGAMNTVPLALFAHEFVETVWSTARVTVDRLGPDRVIALHRDRLESLTDLLVRGGEKALKAQQELTPMQFRWFNHWPGWSQGADHVVAT